MKKRLLIAFLFFIGSYNSIAQNSINFDPPCVTPGDPITISVQDPSGNDLNVYWINQPNITFLTPNTPTGSTQTTVIFNTGASNLIALDVNTFIPVINTSVNVNSNPFYINCNNLTNECEGAEIDLIDYIQHHLLLYMAIKAILIIKH